MTAPTEIKIQFGGLEETPLRGGQIILRGSIVVDDLQHILFGDYQRELLPMASRASIFKALKAGDPLPDIELGMRGKRVRSRGDDYWLGDPVYGIDGQQRINSAIEYAAQHPQANVRLGCCVHFDTTEAWERERFQVLNAYRTKVSPNVLLKNLRDQHRPVLTLYGLTHQSGFVLHDRVCWMQNKQRNHLLTALTCLKMMAHLHSHLAPGLANTIPELLACLGKLESVIGIQNIRDNVGAFWNLIDECFGIRRIEYSQCAPHLRTTFLAVFARLLSSHSNFWRNGGKQLFVDAPMRRKIAMFDMNDDEVRRLCGSSGMARELLYGMLLREVNKGKTTKRLVPWDELQTRKPRSPKTINEQRASAA